MAKIVTMGEIMLRLSTPGNERFIQAYTFIWGMAGENQDFDDMDGCAMSDLM